MKCEPHYQCDREFLKLMMRRDDVDLTVAALELARDAYPRLDFQPTLTWIEQRAAELAPAMAAKSELDLLRELSRCLAVAHGFQGDPACLKQADGSYLNRVVETQRGIPISLSVLYMAVAERVGLELHGVSAPLHFLTRYESAAGPLFVDAYTGGRILAPKECVAWISEIARMPASEVKRSLKPVGPRTIVIRMLNNLKALHAQQEDWPAAWIVQHRLAALQPASYQERRDLALISLRANRPGPAIDLLEACLPGCPPAEKKVLQYSLEEAKSQLARWN
jgi:regulator of sirC expression with transglutaminase-like and TPR domain